MFLVSPPSSPPPEFDYSRCEQSPSESTPPVSRDQSNQGPVTILNSSVANITVFPCADETSQEVLRKTYRDADMGTYQPTSMPPKSIFDDSDDDLE